MPTRRSDATQAAGVLADTVGLDVVLVGYDGAPMLAALAVHQDEHSRRQRLGTPAVTDRALLHGLWLLAPAGVTPRDQIPANKQKKLDRAPHLAARVRGGYRRLYQPAATVRAVGMRGFDALRCVRRALKYPPILHRYAIVDRHPSRLTTRTAALATEWEVGILAVDSDGAFRQIVPPGAPHTGIPSVYRWWIAELAYAQWRTAPLAAAPTR